jgi:hypothetical protein
VDRAAGDQFLQVFPDIAVVARAARAFMGRAVRYLADEAGVRQFMDVGTGLPVAGSTHEIAQQVAPESRIVYVDNDPVVLAHAQALLVSAPEGATDYVDADMREPEHILQAAAKTLDFSRPVAIMLLGVLGHVVDDGEAQSIVQRLVDAAPSGSYLVLSDGTNVIHGDQGEAASRTTTRAAPRRTACAARSSSAGSSTGWTWWSPAWSRFRGGGPRVPGSRTRWTSSVR